MSSPATVDVIARTAPSSRAVVRETTWIAALTVLLLGALVLPPLGFLIRGSSAVVALLIGWVTAWIVERTNTPLKPLAYLTAIVSLGTPYILYVSAWLLLL